MSVRVEPGDMLDVIPRLVAEGVVCDAVVTDPPYHLVPTQKRFGAANSAPAQHGRDGAMARLSGGFMGKSWDGGDIAFRPETWATVYTILRPGAFLLAFGGTRTYHRLVCAIEDAGFVVQDQIAWVFGSGFPKRKDMLKPAFEPICLAYKPGGKRTLQVDECRIASETIRTIQTPSRNTGIIYGVDQRTRVEFVNDCGRWPANLCHDGSNEVLETFPDAPGQQGDVRGTEPSQCFSGVYSGPKARQPFARHEGEASARRRYADAGATDFAALPGARRNDPGSAARFFYCAKADAQDRWGSRHPTVKPVELIRYLVKLICPVGGLFLDPFAGSGTSGVAALAEGRSAILIEREAEYLTDIRERLAHYEGDGKHSLSAKARRTPQKPDEGLFAEVAAP